TEDRLTPRLRAIGEARQINLSPLPESDARELAHRLLARGGAHVVDGSSIAEEAGGHPMFILELVRHALAGGPQAASSQPVRLDEALWSRIQRLDPAARALLEVLALAGGPVASGIAARAAGLSPAELARRLGELRALHLVRTRGQREDDFA